MDERFPGGGAGHEFGQDHLQTVHQSGAGGVFQIRSEKSGAEHGGRPEAFAKKDYLRVLFAAIDERFESSPIVRLRVRESKLSSRRDVAPGRDRAIGAGRIMRDVAPGRDRAIGAGRMMSSAVW